MIERAFEAYRAELRACPSADVGVGAWLTKTADLAATAGVPAAVAVAEITAALSAFRPPSPAGEVGVFVARAYWEAGTCVPELDAMMPLVELRAFCEEWAWRRAHEGKEVLP